MNVPGGTGTFRATAATTNTGTGILDPGSMVNPAAWVPGNYTVQFDTPTQLPGARCLERRDRHRPVCLRRDPSPCSGRRSRSMARRPPAIGSRSRLAGFRDVFETLDSLVERAGIEPGHAGGASAAGVRPQRHHPAALAGRRITCSTFVPTSARASRAWTPSVRLARTSTCELNTSRSIAARRRLFDGDHADERADGLLAGRAAVLHPHRRAVPFRLSVRSVMHVADCRPRCPATASSEPARYRYRDRRTAKR